MNKSLPRVRLANLPTPIEPLPRLSEVLNGPRLFVKRDDLTGLAGGGNKTRKLELLVADARQRNADSLITVGAAQSNHCRQTAAAAAKCGMRSILVLRGCPPSEETGNVLLDRLLGAELCWSGERSREDVMDEIVAREKGTGGNPYPIPLGGSNALGASAYAFALEEVLEQSRQEFHRIIFASSSGGTHAGLVAGAQRAGFRGQILGISIDEPKAELQEMVARIATEVAELLGTAHTFSSRDINVDAGYLGKGYGIVGAPEREAINLFARTEGMLLDPVYTGRAASGLIDLIRRGEIGRDETILFWHTGGTPALWAYGREL